MQVNRRFVAWIGSLIVLVALASAIAYLAWPRGVKQPQLPAAGRSITIASPHSPGAGPLFVAQELGFFRQHGVDVTVQPHTSGKSALQAMLQGNADLAIVADTPIVFAIVDGASVSILTMLAKSRHENAVIARRDRGVSMPSDLRRKTIGATLGTSGHFFLDTFLLAHRVPGAEVKLLDLAPEQMIEAIRDGRVDAVSTWHPYIGEVEQALGDQGVTFFGDELYTVRFLLVAERDSIARNSDRIHHTLAAMGRAVEFIHHKPSEARQIIARFCRMDATTLERLFDPRDYELGLDQALLLTLDDETRWARKRGFTAMQNTPNYLQYLHLDAMKSINRDSVRVIH